MNLSALQSLPLVTIAAGEVIIEQDRPLAGLSRDDHGVVLGRRLRHPVELIQAEVKIGNDEPLQAGFAPLGSYRRAIGTRETNPRS